MQNTLQRILRKHLYASQLITLQEESSKLDRIADIILLTEQTLWMEEGLLKFNFRLSTEPVARSFLLKPLNSPLLFHVESLLIFSIGGSCW